MISSSAEDVYDSAEIRVEIRDVAPRGDLGWLGGGWEAQRHLMMATRSSFIAAPDGGASGKMPSKLRNFFPFLHSKKITKQTK